MTRRSALRIALIVAAGLSLFACDSQPAPPEVSYEGQGEAVTADPAFEVALTIEGSPETKLASEMFLVYEAKPGTEKQKERPQTWELIAAQSVLAGVLPEDLKVAPRRTFADLTGKPFKAAPFGGDPASPSMSKIKLPDDKVYVMVSGTMQIEKVFHRKGQYAGVTGRFETMLQQIKLGDTEDPNNKGDQPIGAPVKATGVFTAKAKSIPYEQL